MSVTDLSVLMAACGVIVCVPLWFVRLIGKGDSHYNFTIISLSFYLFVCLLVLLLFSPSPFSFLLLAMGKLWTPLSAPLPGDVTCW